MNDRQRASLKRYMEEDMARYEALKISDPEAAKREAIDVLCRVGLMNPDGSWIDGNPFLLTEKDRPSPGLRREPL